MLEGKSIIVTGGGRGIGHSSAVKFAGYGAKILILDLDAQAAERTAEEIRSAGGEAVSMRADVTVEADVIASVEAAVRAFGRLDGAFNNAGVAMRGKSLMDLTVEDWDSVFAVNVTAVFLCMKHQMRAMKDQGSGSIVNSASVIGMRGQINAADLVASKHAVIGITRTGAIEGGLLGIRVNAVCPGLVLTPEVDALLKSPGFAPQVPDMLKMHRLGRFATPDDIAEGAAWLLSDRSAFVTGTPLALDGGVQA